MTIKTDPQIKGDPMPLTWGEVRNKLETEGARNVIYDGDLDGIIDEASIDAGITRDTELASHETATGGIHGVPATEYILPSGEKGAADGIATLDVNALVPLAQIPTIPDAKLEIPPGLKEVAEIDVTADTTQITITGLDILADKFYWLILSMKNPTATAAEIAIYINGDTTATNYYVQKLGADGATISADRKNDNEPWYCAAGQNCLGWALLTLTPDGYATIYSAFNWTELAAVTLSNRYTQHKVAQTNITRLDFICDVTNAIGAGSKLLIFSGR